MTEGLSSAPDAPRHGGDLTFATARYRAPAAGWLDLSTGINPRAYPIDAIDALSGVGRLPEPAALAALCDVARANWSVPAGVLVAAVPGTELAIRLLPQMAPDGPVTVFGPTYGSHGEAWRRAGRAVVETSWPGTPVDDARIVVLCNPNNPDGRLISGTDLRGFVAAQTAAGRLTVVDEAFIDLSLRDSLVPMLAGLDAVVLRSFGKFHGLAGLRLGFVLGAPGRVDPLRALLGDWPVSSPAIRIGRKALADHNWQEATRSRLAEDSRRLRAILDRHGLAVAGSTDLFTLVRDDAAYAIHDGLARHGIWTRVFDQRPDWLRIGLPGNADALARLDLALAAIRSRRGE